MSNNISPDYLSTLVPQPIENTIGYNLLDASYLRQPFSRTELYYKSFLPSSIRLWNDLSYETREAPSFTSFKYQVPNKKEHKKHLDTFHLAIDMHKYLCSKNIVNDPYCQCGAIETTKHYLFECHRYMYRQIREEMINVISRYCTHSLNCLLYGDERFNFNCNYLKAKWSNIRSAG